MCKWALFPKTATILVLIEQAFRRMPSFTEWVIASSFEVILATLGLSSGTSGSRCFRSFCCMKEFGHGFDSVTFPRSFVSWRKLQLSPFTHCPLVSHCQQSPRILCTRCFVPRFLTTAFFSNFHFWPQNYYFEFPATSYNSNTILSFFRLSYS